MILIKKSMPIVGFLTCNGSGIFCGPKLVPIGGLDTELISHLHRVGPHGCPEVGNWENWCGGHIESTPTIG